MIAVAHRSLLLAVAALLLAVVPAFGQQAPVPGDVVINELLYDPPAGSAPGEYVELLNRSEQPVALAELAIADSRDQPVSLPRTAPTLAPGAYAVLVQDAEAFAAVFPGVDFVEPSSWPQLNNAGDTAQLLHDGTVLDAVPYASSWGGEDVALERIDPAGPSDEASNFGSSLAAVGTPGATNSLAGGTEDTTPPVLEEVTVALSRRTLTAVFSESLDPSSVTTSAFSIEGEGAVPTVTGASVDGGGPARVGLALSGEIAPGAYELAVRGVRDAAGNVQEEDRAAFAVAPGSVPEPRAVVVNELWPAPENPALEFVELYNRSGETFDLSRFHFSDERRTAVSITDETALLRPGEHVVLVREHAAFEERFPDAENVFEVAPWPALNNGGDEAVVSFGSGADRFEIDAVAYEPFWGGTAEASLERRDPAGPSTRSFNFGTSTAPVGATPGARNALFAPDTRAPRPVFAREVLGAAAVFAVGFDEPLNPTSVEPGDFALGGQSPASVTLSEDGQQARLVFESAPVGGGAEDVQLTARDLVDLTGNVLDRATVAVAFVAASYERRPPGDLTVSEILYDPLADDFDDRPNQPEYVEVQNRTGRRLALEGYFLTDQPDESGAADTLFVGRSQASVPAGGFVVIYAAGSDEGSRVLEDAFPEIDFERDDLVLLPVDRASLGLANAGDLVALHRPDGVRIDSVFYRPNWHSRAVDDGDGRALERLDVDARSNDPANWTTATSESGGTPGHPNGAAPPPGGSSSRAGLEILPSPFSPDGDGIDDQAFIQYTLEAPVSLARVRIYDSTGREVYEREAALAGRTGQIVWDGHASGGDALRIGIYVVLFEALDADGGTVRVFKAPVVLARPLD